MKPRPSVLLTRNATDNAPLGAYLESLGYATLQSPMYEIIYLPTNPEASDTITDIIATSRHALESLTNTAPQRVYAVGPATAETAQAKWPAAHIMRAAQEGADPLLQLILDTRTAQDGQWLYPRGNKVTLDMAKALKQHGFSVRACQTYKTRPIEVLTEMTQKAFLEEKIDYVVFFSQQTAQNFAKIIAKQKMSPCLRKVTAVCLSYPITQKIESMVWGDLVSLSAPQQQCLHAYFHERRNDNESTQRAHG